MQTQNYYINTHKAAREERDKDYPMAAVHWKKANESATTEKLKHWTDCRLIHCEKMAENWGVE